MNVFVSGSMSKKELPPIATQKLDNIISKNITVLVGGANGVDSLIQRYLMNKNYANVCVYFVGAKPRNNIGNWQSKNIKSGNEQGRAFFTLKDAAMANEADYGLMVWDGKSKGTKNNVELMKQKNKKFYLILNGELLKRSNPSQEDL